MDELENTSNSSPVENNHVGNQDLEPSFCDDDEEMPLSILTKNQEDDDVLLSKIKLKKDKEKSTNCIVKTENIISQLNITLTPEDLKIAVDNLYTELNNATSCQIMERIVQIIVNDDLGVDMITPLASGLSTILNSQIVAKNFSLDNLNDESLMDSISTPLFMMFRNFFQLCENKDDRQKFLGHVLAELQIFQPRIGYLLLYFLKVWVKKIRKGLALNVTSRVKASVYEDFCLYRKKNVDVCLLSDLKLCHEDNGYLLCYLVPDIFMGFQNIALANSQLLYLVVSTIDSYQLQELVCQIMQGQLKMLKKDSITNLITISLDWKPFEQYRFWQLVSAHDFSIEYILPILPKLQFKDHADALTSILLMLKEDEPTLGLLKQLFARQSTDRDLFVVAALRYWCQDFEEKLAKLIANLLHTRFPETNSNKRKRARAKRNLQFLGPPTGEQVLGHLDQLQQHCRVSADLRFYQTKSIQKILQQIRTTSTDSFGKRYGDLFALAKINEENESSQPTSLSREHTAATKRNRNSEDKMITKPKQAKKRKKND